MKDIHSPTHIGLVHVKSMLIYNYASYSKQYKHVTLPVPDIKHARLVEYISYSVDVVCLRIDVGCK